MSPTAGEYGNKLRRVRREKQRTNQDRRKTKRKRIRRDKIGVERKGRQGGPGEQCKTFFESSCTTRWDMV